MGTKAARKNKPGTMSLGKHGRCGRATKSPKFRHAAKREAEAVSVVATNRIRDPKESVSDLFR